MKSKIRKGSSIVSVLILFGLLLVITEAAESQPVMTLNAVDAWGHTIKLNMDSFLNWIDKVEKASAGRIKIKYLGGPDALSPLELPDHCQKGTIDLFHTSPAYYTKTLPESETIHFVRPEDQRSEWLRGSGFINLYNEALVSRKGVMLLASVGPRHDALLFSNKPITSDDWSRFKIRAPGPLVGTFLSAMGAAPTVVASPEVLEALGRGIIDGQLRPPQDAYKNKEFEYTGYCLGPTFVSYFTGIFINKKKWDEIPKDLKEVIMKETIQLEKHYDMYWPGIVAEAVKEMSQRKLVKYSQLSSQHRWCPWKTSWDKELSPNLLSGYSTKFEKILEGHATWGKFYPPFLSEYVSK
jgi:TRAP-type C4-dicarboxylate transport system substrate-binding protein